jgi:hypothetical protein
LNWELIIAMDLRMKFGACSEFPIQASVLLQGREGTDEERPTVREKRTENKFTIQDVTSVSRMAILIPLYIFTCLRLALTRSAPLELPTAPNEKADRDKLPIGSFVCRS